MLKSKLKSLSPDFIINFFTKGHERSRKAKRNIFASFMVKGISILISLALVPITIKYVNPTNYGIWLTLSSIIGWASFFDIGFGNGLRNRFTEAITLGKHELARIYISTTYAILSIIILTVFVIFLFVNFWLDWSKILNTSPDMASGLNVLAIIVFAFFSMQFVFQLITTILTADQKPALAGFLNMLSSLLSLILILILIKFTKGNLIYLGYVMGGSPIIILLGSTIWFFRKKYRQYKPSFLFVKFSYAKDLMNLGVQFFIIQIKAITIFTTSNIIISQLFGPAEVTIYNIALKYFSLPIAVFNIILAPFWSAFTEAYCRSDHAWIKSSVKGLLKIWALMSVLTIIMIFSADLIYRIWVGPEIKIPFGITCLMGLYAIMINWNNIFAFFLNGIGKIRVQLYSSTILGVLTIPVAVLFGKAIGLEGVILGSCLIMFLNSLFTPIQYFKIVRGTATGIWLK